MLRSLADPTTAIPSSFCWSKFGTEAGEAIGDIRGRKEQERQAGDGLFLWGIGNSIGPSIALLLRDDVEPVALFTPMLSKPARLDVRPERVVTWSAGVGLDGMRYELPAHCMVTSKAPLKGPSRSHYALVCHSEAPIDEDEVGASFSRDSVVNLRSGSPVGSSQVTSVVRHQPDEGSTGMIYSVAFRARLVYPFVVRLAESEGHCAGYRNDLAPRLW